jgi:hypothetical protein
MTTLFHGEPPARPFSHSRLEATMKRLLAATLAVLLVCEGSGLAQARRDAPILRPDVLQPNPFQRLDPPEPVVRPSPRAKAAAAIELALVALVKHRVSTKHGGTTGLPVKLQP